MNKLFCYGFPILTAVIIILFLDGCVKEQDFDFDKVTGSKLSPDLAIPLIYSDLTIKDIAGISENSMFTTGSNGQLSLIYNTNIYSLHGYELFTPSSQSDHANIQLVNTDTLGLSFGTVTKSFNRIINLTFPNNEQIDSMTLRAGMLNLNIASTVSHNTLLNIKIPTATKSGIVFSKDIIIPACSGSLVSVIESYDMSDYNMRTAVNGVPDKIAINYTLTIDSTGSGQSTANNLDLQFQLDSIKPASVFGYLGQREFTDAPDTAEIGIFNNFQSGLLYFDDPKMTVTITNSFGIPVDAQIGTLSAILSNGTTVPFGGPVPSPLIGYPYSLGQEVKNSFVFDKNNSNICTILNQSPKSILHGINIQTNKPLPAYNFMSDSSILKADLKFELPLKGYASGFSLQDTIDFSLGEIDMIESASFRLNISNGFPVDAHLQLYFTDDNYNILDSLLDHSQSRLVESATVDQDGKVISPTVRSSDEDFDNDRLQHLFKAKKILMKATIQTADAPNRSISIYDNYHLEFKVGVHTKLNLEF